jgi:hypothetical protein
MLDLVCAVVQRGFEPQRRERPDGVRRQIHAGTWVRPAGGALDDIRFDALLQQRACRGEACNPTADDKDMLPLRDLPLR